MIGVASGGRPVRRLMILASSLLALGLLLPAAAGAANLTATDARSTITGVDPPASFVHASVIGGDAAIRLAVDPGHEVIIGGYEGEPYLRLASDGTVAVNTSSPAMVLNRTRTGGTESSGAVDPGADPLWVSTGSGGEVVWHDHRIHAMSAADQTHDWSIGLLIDGRIGLLTGTLTSVPGPSPLPWILLIVVATAAMILLGRRRAVEVSALLATLAGVIGLVESLAVLQQTPSVLGREPLAVIAAALAVVTGLVAIVTSTRVRLVATAASLGLSGGVLAPLLADLTHVVVPGLGSAVSIRIGVAVCTSLVLAGAVLDVVGAGRPGTVRTRRSPTASA